MTHDEFPTASPFIDPCKNGHSPQKHSDGWVYCRRCGKRVWKG